VDEWKGVKKKEKFLEEQYGSATVAGCGLDSNPIQVYTIL
jgi:hypothetical protein